jgi:hypothetical protein
VAHASIETMAESLRTGPLYWFSDWPNREVPNLRCGVYTVWDGGTFVYVGMAGRSLAPDAYLQPDASTLKRNRGLRDRLSSHASGRRSGDQFCIYVCDRLVLATMTANDLKDVASGKLSLDERTREYIRTQLAYRFVTTQTSNEARALERKVQSDGLNGVKPLLNPRPSPVDDG